MNKIAVYYCMIRNIAGIWTISTQNLASIEKAISDLHYFNFVVCSDIV